MFTTFLKVLSGYFGKHWLLSAFLPSLAFWSFALLVFANVRGVLSPVEFWRNQSGEFRVLIAMSALGWVTFFAYLLGSFQTTLIRFFEGYWQSYPLLWLRNRRLRYHRRVSRYLKTQVFDLTDRIQRLEDESAAVSEARGEEVLEAIGRLRANEAEWFLSYPPEEDAVMPTRLGNIIRAAEFYAYERYRIDAVVVWPRLYPFLPESFIGAMLSAKTDMTVMLMLSALAFTFAVIACALLAVFTNHWIIFLFSALGFWLAWMFYLTSLLAAQLYAELIKSAFDLHRWKLLEALHIKLPTTYVEERAIWDDVSHLIYRNEPLTLARYDTAAESAPTTTGLSPLQGFMQTIQEAVAKLSNSDANTVTDETRNELPPTKNEYPLGVKKEMDHAGFWYFGVIATVCLIVVPLMRSRGAHDVEVPVLARDAPRYHLVTEGELKRKSVDPGRLSSDALREEGDILDHYTLEPVPADAVMHRGQLQAVKEPSRLIDTVLIGIPASPAMVLGGNLRAGDFVNIVMVRDTNAEQPPYYSGIFENILVLDVRPASEKPGEGEKASDYPFVVVIALPAKRTPEFAVSSAGARFTITRRD